ncbi:MAG: Ig-like domain-containing protein [Clostridia bacterium]|nr:Ig-like domain-containing protein [Clostridia bacterium]
MISYKRFASVLLILVLAVTYLSGCTYLPMEGQTEIPTSDSINSASLSIVNGGRYTIGIGETVQLQVSVSDEAAGQLIWSSTSDCVTVSESGLVTGVSVGKAAVKVRFGELSDTAIFEVVGVDGSLGDPYENMSAEEFYADYEPADSYTEAYYRTQHGFMSGELTVPDQAPELSEYRPQQDGYYVRNSDTFYLDDNSYVVVDAYGEAVLTVYRGGAYITLEEVAAYVYAFGNVPANYVSDKDMEPEDSIWGEYLRLNHSSFSGNTDKYPYEPELPNISGCGGELYYYEIDIGTTGTDCDPKYRAALYNNGQSITRGAARIVYTRYDKNRNEIIEPNEKHVFYTYNHYNDFQEYLNYYGGWGEMFGNITGGGKISSKTDYNPTAYVPVVMASISISDAAEMIPENQFLELIFLLPINSKKR